MVVEVGTLFTLVLANVVVQVSLCVWIVVDVEVLVLAAARAEAMKKNKKDI